MKLYEKMNSGVYVIAEMSANHAGKIENAFKIIEEAAKAGADCVKIQTYTADTLTIDCREEPYQIKGGLWDGYNYYQPYQAAYYKDIFLPLRLLVGIRQIGNACQKRLQLMQEAVDIIMPDGTSQRMDKIVGSHRILFLQAAQQTIEKSSTHLGIGIT